jgi:hypothetical protein
MGTGGVSGLTPGGRGLVGLPRTPDKLARWHGYAEIRQPGKPHVCGHGAKGPILSGGKFGQGCQQFIWRGH